MAGVDESDYRYYIKIPNADDLWREVSRKEYIGFERMCGFSAPDGKLATHGFTARSRMGDKIMGRVDLGSRATTVIVDGVEISYDSIAVFMAHVQTDASSDEVAAGLKAFLDMWLAEEKARNSGREEDERS